MKMLVFLADGMDYGLLRSGEVETPFINELMSRGAHGEMRIIYEEERIREGATIPHPYSEWVKGPIVNGGGPLLYYSMTPLSLTCIFTGMLPWNNHVPHEKDYKIYSRIHIKSPLTWEILNEKGVPALQYSLPPPVAPPDGETNQFIYPGAWNEDKSSVILHDGEELPLPELYRRDLKASEDTFNLWKKKIEESDFEVIFLYYKGIDIVNHLFFDLANPERKAKWRGNEEELTSLVVNEFYRLADEYLRELSTGFDYVMVISDHGTERSHHTERATFILVGPTIPPGEVYGVRSIDVTPTILHLMEADGDYEFDGVNLFLSLSEQEEELRKLRALGYIE